MINEILKCNELQMDRPKSINGEDWSYLCDLEKSIKGKIDNNKSKKIALNDIVKKLIEDEEETKYIKRITNIVQDNKLVQ